MEKKWYIVHTYSGYESKVKTALQKRIKEAGMESYFGEIIVPQQIPQEKSGPHKKGKKLLPGYIFVEMVMTDETWHLVRKTPKVTGFVSGGKKPIPAPRREIEQIKRQISEGVVVEPEEGELEKGSEVKITSGPFTNFVGVIDDIKPEKKKVRVLVSIFGRSTPIDLEFNQIEKIK